MSIEARNGIVHPLLALGKTDMVIKMYKEILEISPNETSANYRLALIYYQKGQYKEAEKHLLLVINFFPFDYDTVVLLGWNYYRMGKFNDAKILFQKALLFKPNDESASEGLKLVN
jgi:tetratricopeptide (TPR) repeat protein